MNRILSVMGIFGCLALAASGCSSKTSDKNNVLSAADVNGSKELQTQKIKRNSFFLGAPGFLVKDSEVLRNSINECLQTGLLAIKPEMIRGGGGAGRENGILSQSFADHAGKRDIIEVLSSDLYDPARVTRVDTAAGYLTIEYMGALATVADVVAWNCEFGVAGSQCDCSTEEQATKILQRCIPSYADIKIADAAKKFAQECSSADLRKKRQILASFLASSTFAESR
ncbi:MAG: hypothetical protein EBR09_02235 [Proteobacteria bacterium]|nr:hypothetical protein [Pseudomonadota bacterium]